MISLVPFSTSEQSKHLKISVKQEQTSAHILQIEFHFIGNLDLIRWPTSGSPRRQDKLWEQTCLECFFKTTASPEAYREINCSPEGSWNAYSFTSYRQGMQPSSSLSVTLKKAQRHSHDAFFVFDVSSTAPLNLTDLGLSAVIEGTDGSISYWALSHPNKDADFHDSKAWTALSTR